MNIEYEFILGKKYKKCREDQIRNPLTMRCIKMIKKKNMNNDTIHIKKKLQQDKLLKKQQKEKEKALKKRQLALEKLLKKQQKEKEKVLKKRQLALEKLLKKQQKEKEKEKEKEKLLKKQQKEKKKKLNKNSTNKIETQNKAAFLIQKKMKAFLSPFINRVSANIYDRIIYFKKLIKNIKLDSSKNNYCVKFYKFGKDMKPIFRIGNNIILKKQIGSLSSHGSIYLSSFRDKNKKLFKYAIKVIPITYKSLIEIKINEILSNAVLNNKCPHFPFSYGNIKCLKDDIATSSFISSTRQNNNIKKIPLFHLHNKDYLVYLTELASGDLKTFDKNIGHNIENTLLGNTISQIFLSLMFYYKYIGSYHCDAHSGNFLYHKIKKGGFYHYHIFNKDYYLENMGYLWIIWDYEQSVSLKSLYSNHNHYLTMGYDFITILSYFYKYNNKNITLINNNLFTSNSNTFYNKPYDKKLFEKFIESILNYLCTLGYIQKKINDPNMIINKYPYIIDNISEKV